MSVLNPADIRRFQQLFRGRENIHGQTTLTESGEKKASWTEHYAAPEAAWVNHLEGNGPGLGLGASTTRNECYFAALDHDDPTDHAALAAIVEHAELPLVVCRSKSGDGHLFVFFSEPVPAKLVVERLRQWAQFLGIDRRKTGKQKGQPIEVFPKSFNLQDNNEGNWINLPYYAAWATVRYAVLPDGSHLSFSDFLDYAEGRRISAAELEGLVPESMWDGGPPCLRAVDREGVEEGARNQMLYNTAIMLKLKHKESGGNWKTELIAYNKSGSIDPPVKEAELRGLIRSIDENNFAYKCTEFPIEPHCDKKLCKKQPFGIHAFVVDRQKAAMPPISRLRKLTTDPPRWMLHIDGVDVSLATDDLMLIPRFRRAVMNSCSKIFPLMKQGDWDDVLGTLLAQCEVIEAPEDAGTLGQFKGFLFEFLTRRRHAESLEDLLNGLPFEQGNEVIFRSADLMAFLERKKFREYTTPEVYQNLQKIGCTDRKVVSNGVQVRIWALPTPRDEQTEEFRPKVIDEPEM